MNEHCYCPHFCMIVEYDRLGGVGVILFLMSLSRELDFYLFSCFLIYQDKDYISCLKWLETAVLWQKASYSWLKGIRLKFRILAPNNKQAQ